MCTGLFSYKETPSAARSTASCNVPPKNQYGTVLLRRNRFLEWSLCLAAFQLWITCVVTEKATDKRFLALYTCGFSLGNSQENRIVVGFHRRAKYSAVSERTLAHVSAESPPSWNPYPWTTLTVTRTFDTDAAHSVRFLDCYTHFPRRQRVWTLRNHRFPKEVPHPLVKIGKICYNLCSCRSDFGWCANISKVPDPRNGPPAVSAAAFSLPAGSPDGGCVRVRTRRLWAKTQSVADETIDGDIAPRGDISLLFVIFGNVFWHWPIFCGRLYDMKHTPPGTVWVLHHDHTLSCLIINFDLFVLFFALFVCLFFSLFFDNIFVFRAFEAFLFWNLS